MGLFSIFLVLLMISNAYSYIIHKEIKENIFLLNASKKPLKRFRSIVNRNKSPTIISNNNDEIKSLSSNKNNLISKEKLSTPKQILSKLDYIRTPNPLSIETKNHPLISELETIAIAADNRKAGNIHAMRVEEWTEVTTFIVIVEGNSKPQNQAIALSVEVTILIDKIKCIFILYTM
jgi:hypothetical protein